MPSEEVSIYIRLKDMATAKMKGFARHVGITGARFDLLQAQASAALIRVRKLLNQVGTQIIRWGKWIALAGGAFAFYFGQRMVKSIIEVGSKYEMLKNQVLIALRGIRSATDATWKKILDFAARSPLMTDQVVAAFATLKSAGVSAAFEVTKTLGSLALTFGRRVDELAGVFLGAETEVFRRMGILIDRTGKKAIIQTAAWKVEVEKDMRSIWAGLAEVIDKSFGDAMGLAQRTWDGAVNTMKGKWDVFLDTIAKAGVLEWFTSVLQTINEEWDKLTDKGVVDVWAKQISDAIIGMTKNWAILIRGLQTAYNWFLNIGITIETLRPSLIKLRGNVTGWESKLKDVRTQLAGIKKDGMAPDPGAWEKLLRLMDDTWEKLGIPPIGLDPSGKSFVDMFGSGADEAERVEDAVARLTELERGLVSQIAEANERLGLRGELLAKSIQLQKDIASNNPIELAWLEKFEATMRKRLALEEQARRGDEMRTRLSVAATRARERLADVDKRRTGYLKEQERIKKSLVTLGNEEAAKIEYVARNLDKMTGKYLAQNEEVREIVAGHEGLTAILEKQLRTAKDIVEGEGRRLIAAEGRRRGIEVPEEAEKRFAAEKVITRQDLERAISGQGPQAIQLEANIELVNNPEVKVAIDMSRDAIVSVMHNVIQDQLIILENKLEEKLASKDKIWAREKAVAAGQIGGFVH